MKNTLGLGSGAYKLYLGHLGLEDVSLAISQEPLFQFSQAGPHFLQNHYINLTKLWNLKKDYDLGVCGLEFTFEPLGPRSKTYQAISPDP